MEVVHDVKFSLKGSHSDNLRAPSQGSRVMLPNSQAFGRACRLISPDHISNWVGMDCKMFCQGIHATVLYSAEKRHAWWIKLAGFKQELCVSLHMTLPCKLCDTSSSLKVDLSLSHSGGFVIRGFALECPFD